MLRDMLTLTGVQVRRLTETTDGMGGLSTVSVITTLSRCQIWGVNSFNRYLSDKVTRASSHVLAIETGEYTFNDFDMQVLNGTNTYTVTGHADDISHQGELTIIGLDRKS